MSLCIPPLYVNLRADATFNPALPDPIFRTYARLAGLAWQDRRHHAQVPACRVNELCNLLGMRRATLWGHLKALRDQGMLEWSNAKGVVRISLAQKSSGAPIQDAGFSLNDVDDVNLFKDLDRSSSTSSSLIPLQNSGLEANPGAREQVGTDATNARALRVASAECAPVECTPPAAQPAAPAASAARKAAELPEAICQGLAEVGWSDVVDEVLVAWQADPQRVRDWLNYARFAEGLKNRAGMFRKGLRSGNGPPFLFQLDEELPSEEAEAEAEECGEAEADLENLPPAPAEQPAPANWERGEDWLLTAPRTLPPVENWDAAPHSSGERRRRETATGPTEPTIEPRILQAWAQARQQMQMSMQPASFDQWLRPAHLIGYDPAQSALIVAAPSAFHRDWLDQRLSFTLNRMLTGMLGQATTVRFMTAS